MKKYIFDGGTRYNGCGVRRSTIWIGDFARAWASFTCGSAFKKLQSDENLVELSINTYFSENYPFSKMRRTSHKGATQKNMYREGER